RHWEKTYFEWMRNIQDWCISRQLWWGHRIPAWYCDGCDHITVMRETPERCGGCGGTHIRQDEDVLDTWFSSGLWPFSTLGWPRQTKEMEAFYPTDVLVTGFDIIFFWVARMIMMGLKFTGQVPFRDVYIHALIRDAQGQKMSKSKGNVIDPLAMIEDYGADALRFTLAHMATPGRDVKLDVKRIESNRNFMNKIWNAARFVFMNRGEAQPDSGVTPQRVENQWILAELADVRDAVEKALVEYRFNEAADGLYHFIWDKYCDWYVEAAKVALYGEDEAAKAETRVVMLTVLDGWLRLLHPICPFISETLFQELHGAGARLVTSGWAQPLSPQPREAASRMRRIIEVVSAIRSIRGEMNVPPGKRVEVNIAAAAEVRAGLEAQQEMLMNLARIETLTWLDEQADVEGAAVAPLAWAKVFLPLAGLVNVAEELARIEKNMTRLDKDIARLEGKLGNPKFREHAPEEIVAGVQVELDEARGKRAELAAAASRLKPLA
ncbi:MAG: class I tRNA ligase family protein, partial [Mariprofundaceae bacterium]|nr:class I tRNA ligase family protein [Mariprofundaceae bacterium]